LSDLILELEKFSEIKRIRYTTSHPKDMSNDLIEVYKSSKKLMPLVHLPVQSGSNKVLGLMNRKHTVSDYYKVYDELKEINPNIQFSSDFIIGYPGEEEEDFKATLELIKKIKFINSYSFIFSPRPGTVAADLNLIHKKISMERLEKIQSQLYDNQMLMNKSLENKTINVLVENLTEDKTQVFGRSEHMTSVIFNGKKEDVGKIVPVKIIKSNRSSLFGERVFRSNQKVA
jgi:tRNA-2-methylthio-N6-dimethylallyladenosine synthase